MRFLVLICVFGFLVGFAVPVLADESRVDTRTEALLGALSERLVKQIRRNPGSLVEDAAEVILSFGAAGGIGPDGLKTAVLAARAKVRARETERFLRADLDNDGTMTGTEVDGLIARTYMGGRGKLKVTQSLADADGDGTITATELRRYADAAAEAAVSDEDVAEAMALMAFDLDADGNVRLDEVARGVEMIGTADLALVRKDI
jgi:hypothetical protein